MLHASGMLLIITHMLWVKKTGPFSLEHNVGKYCPISITLSLLQTEINYDQVYPKICRHTLNLLVHFFVKWTRMYWPTLLAFRNYRCNSQTSHLCVCGQIISVCNSERIIKNGQYLRKLCSNENGPVFLTHSIYFFVARPPPFPGMRDALKWSIVVA